MPHPISGRPRGIPHARAVTGLPLRKYITTLRLSHAQQLLRTTGQSLTTLAVDCGFYDLPHLDKAFRKRFGISPSVFRLRQGGRRHPY